MKPHNGKLHLEKWEKRHGHLGCPDWGATTKEVKRKTMLMVARRIMPAGEPVVR